MQTSELRAPYRKAAEEMQRTIASLELSTSLRYTFTGVLSEDGKYNITIVLDATPHKSQQ